MKFKFFLLIFLCAAIGLGVWAYPILKTRYFSDENFQKAPVKDQAEKEDTLENQPASEKEESIKVPDYKTPEPQSKDVTSDDCDTECARVKDGPGDLAYCQEVCGLSPAPAQNVGQCGEKSGINKDYCLKDEAVSKKDFSICDQISDLGIKKSCQNRITEDLIEQ